MKEGCWLLALGGLLLVACGDDKEVKDAKGSKEAEEQPLVEGDPLPEEGVLPRDEKSLPKEVYGFWVVSPEEIKKINQKESGKENQFGLAAFLTMMLVVEIDRDYITMHLQGDADLKPYRVVQAGDDLSIELAGESQKLELRGDQLHLMGLGSKSIGLRRLEGESLARRKGKLDAAKEKALAGPGRDGDPNDRIDRLMSLKTEAVVATLK